MRTITRRLVRSTLKFVPSGDLLRVGLIVLTAALLVGTGHRVLAQATDADLDLFLPILSVSSPQRIEFNTGYVERCVPNPGVSYVDGSTSVNGFPVNGQMVAFSYEPDGPIVAKIESGPHEGYPNWPDGFFSHILSTEGPRDADWHFWIVDEYNERISAMVYLHTDGWNGVDACHQAVIRFENP